MFPETKEQWAKLLAGQGIQSFLRDNEINTEDELEEYIYDNQDGVYETFRDVCRFYLSEMNDSDSLYNAHEGLKWAKWQTTKKDGKDKL